MLIKVPSPTLWIRVEESKEGRVSAICIAPMSHASAANGVPLPCVVYHGPEVHDNFVEAITHLRDLELVCWNDKYAKLACHDIVDLKPLFEAMSGDAKLEDNPDL